MSDTTGKFILVIDDEKDIADLVTEQLLIMDGRRVFNANSPSEAYMRSLSTKFDLIISDYRMPKTNGVELIKSIRMQKLNSATPIIMISGYKEEATAKVAGIPDVMVLAKPFTNDELENAVTTMMNLAKNRVQKKPQFDIQLLNEFIGATSSIVRQLTGIQEIKPDKPYIYNAKEKPLAADISALLAIEAGKFKGTIALGFPQATYLQLVNGMTKETHTGLTDENTKHAGAIISLIYGQVRASMERTGMKFSEANPQTVVGRDHKIDVIESSVTMVIPIHALIGDFYMLASAV